MYKINLVCLHSENLLPNWQCGKAFSVRPNIPDILKVVQDANEAYPAQAWLFWDPILGSPPIDLMTQLLDQSVDLWHAGLLLGTSGKPGLLDFVSPSRMFSRDPDPTIEATSWRVSLRACLVRSEVLQQIGFLQPEYLSIQGAVLEWGFRCLQHGVLMRHLPAMIPHKLMIQTKELNLPFDDELRFVYNRFGYKWCWYAAMRAAASGYASPISAFTTCRKVTTSSASHQPKPYKRKKEQPGDYIDHSAKIPAVSVLIPTLERYAYLGKLLTQLGQQTIPAQEILVIDQTPKETRQIDFYKQFSLLPIRVKFLDEAGQCSSRNHGLQQATGDYILFLDDDDEIPPDLIQRHIENLSKFDIDASCGVADEVGAGALPKAFTLRRASDVFPANNTMLRKSALRLSGLFDLAYEHGPRADGDLGMRLYLSGAGMLMDPEIRVLHHHAPSGGLRTHKARRITYASSRRSLVQRNLPSITELYLVRRYFNPRQAREHLWLSVLGTFSLHGSRPRQIAKILISAFLLPHTLWQLWHRVRQAQDMLGHYPQIPTYPAQVDPL